MTDPLSPSPVAPLPSPVATSPSGLDDALAASLSGVADLDQDACLRRKAELLGNARSLHELTEPELKEFHAISVRLRQLTTSAGKPAATPRRKAAPTTVAELGDEFA